MVDVVTSKVPEAGSATAVKKDLTNLTDLGGRGQKRQQPCERRGLPHGCTWLSCYHHSQRKVRHVYNAFFKTPPRIRCLMLCCAMLCYAVQA